MTSSIIDFIEARLKADQEAAEATSQGYASITTWKFGEGSTGRHWWVQNDWDDGVVATGGDTSDPDAVVAHIALHDPARVLREVEAKRRVMARHRPNQDGSELTWNREACLGCGGHERWEHTVANVDDVNDCPELRDLAAIWSDHADFDPNWSTT